MDADESLCGRLASSLCPNSGWSVQWREGHVGIKFVHRIQGIVRVIAIHWIERIVRVVLIDGIVRIVPVHGIEEI